VQSKVCEAWLELNRLFESQDAVTKMFFKDKMQTLQMRKGDNGGANTITHATHAYFLTTFLLLLRKCS
jgi:hypothetical protein